VFGFWGLEPQWGDVPAGLAAVAGSIALVIALIGLKNERSQRRSGEQAFIDELKVMRDHVQAAQATAEASARAAEAAVRSAEISEAALRAAALPLLTSVTPGRYPHPPGPGDVGPRLPDDTNVRAAPDAPEGSLLSVAFRNVGTGIAIVTSLGIGTDPSMPTWIGTATSTVVGPGEVTGLRFIVPKDRADLNALVLALGRPASAVEVEVRYTDVNGTDVLRSKAHLSSRAVGDWRVRQVGFYQGDATEPFAMSGPADGDG
jgi:hypothetical protein